MNAEPSKPVPSDENLSQDDQAAAGEGGGVIERALKRLSDRRDVVVWEGEAVQAGPELGYAHDPGSVRSEQLRSLRTELLLRLGTHRDAAAFAILGPRPSEGRSQLCAELALAFAQLAGRTLLVDADLRLPKLHKLFVGQRTEGGLSDVLLGKSGTIPIRRVEGTNGLALLTAGVPPPNPVDLLSGAHFQRLVSDWMRTYDYVLIDTPPSTKYSDGIVVANAVRNVVLVARKNQTSYSEITELQRRLDATETRIIGAVINEF